MTMDTMMDARTADLVNTMDGPVRLRPEMPARELAAAARELDADPAARAALERVMDANGVWPAADLRAWAADPDSRTPWLFHDECWEVERAAVDPYGVVRATPADPIIRLDPAALDALRAAAEA
ncbi:hypothetical protein EMO91_12425 [Bifidobacterium myosotis]|uniref:Uncharacterized protein n=2 Tax=Bifidobacterium myosotis TaxID=1630166 RepID=A0A5M9ZFY0_9BIFI|nr:hypothetical protein EMO91_12425 [Bifidobacterium myosotis]